MFAVCTVTILMMNQICRDSVSVSFKWEVNLYVDDFKFLKGGIYYRQLTWIFGFLLKLEGNVNVMVV